MSDNDAPIQNNQVKYLNPVVPDLQIAEQDLRKISDQLHALWDVAEIEQVEECDFFADSKFVSAYWLLLQKDIRPLTAELVQKTISDHGIAKGMIDGAVGLVALWVSEEGSEFKKSWVAQGIVPERGEDARLEILVELIEQKGVERDDGMIDFSAIEPDFCIKNGTVVARLHLAKAGGADGEDMKGNVVAAQKGKDLKIVAGHSISINRVSEDVWEYVAGRNGVLRNDQGELSIAEFLMVQGDVGYQTGNVDFNGDVFISGSVSSRFNVKANGSVIIPGSVRPTATVMAQGDIIVGEGVLGEKTRLMAIGNVRAQFVQGANVQSGKQIFLGSYAYKAFLRAGNLIKVNKTDGAKGGSVIGGDTWSSADLDIPIAGALTKVYTRLHVGISPTQAEWLEEIQKRLEAGNKVIKQCLIKFRLKQVDLDKVKAILAAATGPQKAMLAGVARQLGEVMKSYRVLLKERMTVTQSLGKDNNKAHVVIREKTFPGVFVQIGNVQQEINTEINSAAYRVQDEKIISERFEG